MDLKASKVAKEALEYESRQDVKKNAIKKFLAKVEGLGPDLDDLEACGNYSLHVKMCLKALKQIRLNLVKSLELFENILACPIQYEGVLINWIRAYEINKIRENRYKVTQNSYKDKHDRNHPLLYYKIFKNYLNYILMAEGMYVCIDINYIWKYIGKQYDGINLLDSFYIIQAKSYLRSNILKSVKKIKRAYSKDKNNQLFGYFFVKYKIEAIKIAQEPMIKKNSKIFDTVNQIQSVGLIGKYKAKLAYLLCELFFIYNSYEKSLEYYKKAEKLFNKPFSDYLLCKKKLVTLKLIEDKLNFRTSDKKHNSELLNDNK